MEGDTLVRRFSQPAVALETAFLTSGLPGEARFDAARRMAAAVRAEDAVPAFTGVLDGRPIVGLEPDELQRLAVSDLKLSTRDLAAALARGDSGGTTVAATIFLAQRAGLPLAATGGIGGVHPAHGPPDVSADLHELARTPAVLVCSGAKAILDLPATLERLETLSVTVVGYRTDEFPAFWSAESGLPVGTTVERADDVAAIYRQQRALGTPGAILVCVPPPPDAALSRDESEDAVAQALAAMRAARVEGAAVTPFLLAKIVEFTEGRSLRANLALLANNAGVAGGIAAALARE